LPAVLPQIDYATGLIDNAEGASSESIADRCEIGVPPFVEISSVREHAGA
jgi:hypothetical protein